MGERLFSVRSGDCRWDYYRGSGKGGQKRNKTSNCVRCTHLASGAVGRAEDGRSQNQNRKKAFRRMAETEMFRTWVRVQAARVSGDLVEIEARLDRQLADPEVTVVHVQEDGAWVPEDQCQK